MHCFLFMTSRSCKIPTIIFDPIYQVLSSIWQSILVCICLCIQKHRQGQYTNVLLSSFLIAPRGAQCVHNVSVLSQQTVSNNYCSWAGLFSSFLFGWFSKGCLATLLHPLLWQIQHRFLHFIDDTILSIFVFLAGFFLAFQQFFIANNYYVWPMALKIYHRYLLLKT